VSAEDGSRIKSAASALLKGGTLVSDQCEKCGGVQVKFGDRVTCINCGNEVLPGSPAPKASPAATIGSAASAMEAKVSALAQELRDERDTAVQRQKVELLEACLRILEKMRELKL
jgi:uncharacterized Zn finger protein (UPF0148 family)